MTANTITVLRMPLLLAIILLLYADSAVPALIAAVLIIVLIILDSVDGAVARRLKQSSLLGSVLDIAADRAVEFLLWVVFADLDLIPVVVPLVVLLRGVFVDSIRGVAPSLGLTPFELTPSPLSRFLVKSPWLRTPYGIVKAIAFCLLAVTRGLQLAALPSAAGFNIAAQIAVWTAVALCLLRGVPVLVEGSMILVKADRQAHLQS